MHSENIPPYFIRRNTTVWLTSCFACLNSNNNIFTYVFGWLQTNQTGGWPNSDTSPIEVSEFSLDVLNYCLPFKLWQDILNQASENVQTSPYENSWVNVDADAAVSAQTEW